MRRKLFLKIVKGISTYEADPLPGHFNFFRVRTDATGRISLSVIMKCTTAIRQLAYGTTPDAFDEYLQMTPVAPYVVNGVEFEQGYYLAGGIYPQWTTFVKSFTVANDAKHAYFKKRQEGARKDVERAFGRFPRANSVLLHRIYALEELLEMLEVYVMLPSLMLRETVIPERPMFRPEFPPP
nr:hypothetical protein [Tanacetum cinerariifolium]